MKISVVIPYYNRKHLLLHGLKSISQTSHKDVEVIIVDDASSQENRLEDILNNYWFPIRLIRIEDEQRWWKRDCSVCMNLGVEAASGEVLMIQNQDCCYVKDVLFDVSQRISNNTCIAYSCYTFTEQDTIQFISGLDVEYYNGEHEMVRDKSMWINHPIFNPTGYHHCMAITPQNWKMLGGMDMDFSQGFAHCDRDLRDKIYFSGLQMVVPHPDVAPFVVHLYHPADYTLQDVNLSIYNEKCFKRCRYYNLLRRFNIGPIPKPFVM